MAIACQGGGSHTAFTAGVLKRLFDAPELDAYDVVGISGTSGGAVCALLAWSALRDGNRNKAGRLLEEFWAENAARGPVQMLLNSWLLWAARWQEYGVLPAVSPYHSPVALIGAEQFVQLLQHHVDFERIDVDQEEEYPVLQLGAVDVLSGQFRVFDSRRDRITADMVLASAAIPNLFRSVRLNGGAYWDGLFSQNPPVHDLLDVTPDELWVIQVNPQHRDDEPTTLPEIADRRNELAGNLSLYQELGFIETIDGLLESGQLSPGGKYKQIVVRIIELSRRILVGRPGAASKLDRDPRFLRDLICHGEQQASEFLAALAFEQAWKQGADQLSKLFTQTAEVSVGPPFAAPGRVRGSTAIRRFVEETATDGLRLDLTHKQVARERVVWAVRLRREGDGPDLPGVAEAEFEDGRVTRLHLGSPPPLR